MNQNTSETVETLWRRSCLSDY